MDEEIEKTWMVIKVLTLKNKEEILAIHELDSFQIGYLRDLVRSDVKIATFRSDFDDEDLKTLSKMEMLLDDLKVDMKDHRSFRLFCMVKGPAGWGLVDSILDSDDPEGRTMQSFNRRVDNGDLYIEVAEAIDWLKPGIYPIYDPNLNVADSFKVD